MNTDDIFRDPAPDWETHPRYRHWRTLLDRKEVSKIEVELYRPREGLTFRPAELFVTLKKGDGSQLPPESVEWDDVVNTALVKLHAQANSTENESQRFGLALGSAFEPVEVRYGEGYFNSVLLSYVNASSFASRPAVARMLDAVHRPEPTKDSTAYDDCTKGLVNVLRAKARELTGDLGYPRGEAEEILANALALYLDERFSVSNRQRLGFI
jgi:hypothetical protein